MLMNMRTGHRRRPRSLSRREGLIWRDAERAVDVEKPKHIALHGGGRYDESTESLDPALGSPGYTVSLISKQLPVARDNLRRRHCEVVDSRGSGYIFAPEEILGKALGVPNTLSTTAH